VVRRGRPGSGSATERVVPGSGVGPGAGPGRGAWSALSSCPLAALVAVLTVLVGLLVGCAAGSARSAGAAVQSTSSAASSGAAMSGRATSRSDTAAGGDSGGVGASCPPPSPNTPGAGESRLPLRSLSALPPEAAQVWHTIQAGGPFRYPRDGIVFNNAEHVLPAHERGYYHEYTVPTPGSPDRGPRRLVTGQGHELYYTGDHYASFVVVDPTVGARR
jgi:ribonuclease T1